MLLCLRTATRLAPIACLALFVHCADLPPIPASTCGNGVIDVGEDCDSFAQGEGTSCGPRGSATQCRFECKSDGPACPTGFGCGVDGVCRQPSGAFAAPSEPISSGAWRIQVGDFDGDGRKDAMTRTQVDPGGFCKLRVHYFDTTGALADTLIIPSELSSPIVSDLTGDGRDDIAFASGGIGVLEGQSDRTLAPIAYPSIVIPVQALVVPIRGFVDPQTDFAVMFLGPAGNGLYRIDEKGLPTPLVQLPSGPDVVAGSIANADVFTVASPCDEAIVPYIGGRDVYVYSACKPGPSGPVWNDNGVATKVTLPPGAKIDTGVRVADVNGDGKLDLLIGADRKTYVATGDGVSAFAAPTVLMLSVKAEGPLGAITSVPIELPLAVGDVSGDNTPDYVLPTSILISTGTPVYELASFKSRGHWTDAAIEDFNGNGYPDIVAGSSTELDLDFFNGTGTSSLNSFTIPTNGSPSHFGVGDVDGDLRPDLVFAQRTSHVSTGDELAIAFGRLGAIPEVPRTVGRFQHIAQNLVYKRAGAIANIAVLSRSTDPKVTTTSIAFLNGTGDRQPLATLALSHVGSTVRGVPLGIVAGAFAGDPLIDLIAFAGDAPSTRNGDLSVFRLWVLSAKAAADFNAPSEGPPMKTDVHPIAGSDVETHVAFLMTSADVDKDGKTDVIGAAPWSGAGQTGILIGAANAGGADGVVVQPREPLIIDATISLEGQLDAGDIDGDGAPELVLLTGGLDSPQALTVYWNDGAGGFAANRNTVIDTAGEEPRGFAFLRVAAPGRALAVVTRTHVYVTHFDKQVVSKRDAVGTARFATGIAAGDFDGDGVEDLALADSANLVVLYAKPVNR